ALDAIVTADHLGRILEFNPAAEQTFGFRSDQVLGTPLADLIVPPTPREAHTQGLEHYLETGVGPVIGKRIETNALRADGTEFPMELAVCPMRQSTPVVFTAYLRDLTERKASEAALAERSRLTDLTAEVALALTRGEDPDRILQHCAEILVRHLDDAFA